MEDGGFSLGLNTRLPKGAFSTYIPMPYALTSKKRAFLLNTTYRTDFELKKTEILFEVETDSVDIVFSTYYNPSDALRNIFFQN